MTSALSVLGLPAQSYLSRMRCLNEIPMTGHRLDTALDPGSQLLQPRADFGLLQAIHQGIIAARDDVLPDHHAQPAQHRKQFGLFAQNPPMAAEQLDLLQQRVRQWNRSAVFPKGTAALGLRVM